MSLEVEPHLEAIPRWQSGPPKRSALAAARDVSVCCCVPPVHATWEEIRELVEGHSGSVVKVFNSATEAQAYHSAYARRRADEPAALVPASQSPRHCEC